MGFNVELSRYVEMFGEPPKLLMTMTYDHEFYRQMMWKAVKRGEPLTDRELELNAEAMGLGYDVIEEPEEEKYNREQKERLDKYLGED